MERNWANKKLHRAAQFRGQNLAHFDFRGATLSEVDFTGSDLSHANFEGANCWAANFTDAVLYKTNLRNAVLARSIMKPTVCFGVTLTISCDTIESMVINDKFWYAWLIVLSMMKAPSVDLGDRLVELIGAERHARYMAVLRDNNI
jgi:hypothetical protein